KPFAVGGEIYSRVEDIRKDANLQSALIKNKAQWISREISNEIEAYPKRKEEDPFLPSKAEIEEWSSSFLLALCERKIIKPIALGEGDSAATVSARFELCSDFSFESKKLPTCEDFFQFSGNE